MSLLKTLLAATLLADPADALAAVKDALATQTLDAEDLTTVSVHDLAHAARAQGGVVVLFTVADVTPQYAGDEAAATAWLFSRRRRIEDRMAETGHETLTDYLISDGLHAEPDEDDGDGEAMGALTLGRKQIAEDYGYSVAFDDSPATEFPYTVRSPGDEEDLAYCKSEADAWLEASLFAKGLGEPASDPTDL